MNTKVKMRLSPYELHCFDRMLDALIGETDPDAMADERCVVSVLLLWQLKIKKLLISPNPKGNLLKLSPPEAYALKAILDFRQCNPADPLHAKLLRLDDDIRKTFYSPIFLTPQLPNHGTQNL